MIFETIDWFWIIVSLLGVGITIRSALRLGDGVLSRTLWMMSVGFLVFAVVPILKLFSVTLGNGYAVFIVIGITIMMLSIVRFTCHTSMKKKH